MPSNDVSNVEIFISWIKISIELPHELVLVLGIDIKYQIRSSKFKGALNSADWAPLRIYFLAFAVVEEVEVYVLALYRIAMTISGFF
jgi:hypothetical protein